MAFRLAGCLNGSLFQELPEPFGWAGKDNQQFGIRLVNSAWFAIRLLVCARHNGQKCAVPMRHTAKHDQDDFFLAAILGEVYRLPLPIHEREREIGDSGVGRRVVLERHDGVAGPLRVIDGRDVSADLAAPGHGQGGCGDQPQQQRRDIVISIEGENFATVRRQQSGPNVTAERTRAVALDWL